MAVLIVDLLDVTRVKEAFLLGTASAMHCMILSRRVGGALELVIVHEHVNKQAGRTLTRL